MAVAMTSEVMAALTWPSYGEVMATMTGTDVGQLLRNWRERRRLSQLDVASVGAVSTRHLSCVETGRSRPSREMVLHLAEVLDVPYRERNDLLVAAGFAPEFRDVGFDSPELQPLRNVLDVILRGHDPHPALVVDAHWNVVAMNDAAWLFAEGVAAHLLEPPMNVMRVSMHPEGLAPRIVNHDVFNEHVLDRIRRQVETTGDPYLSELLVELKGYAALARPADSAVPVDADQPMNSLVLPLQIRARDSVLSFVSTVTTFGAPMDVMPSELAIEAFHPADRETAEALGSRWG